MHWCVLIDLSGTLHVGDNPVHGAIDSLNRLNSCHGITSLLLSNTTKESSGSLLQRLVKIGFQVEDKDLLTALMVAADYVKARELTPLLLLDKDARRQFQLTSDSDCNAVVVGLSPETLNYECLCKAWRLVISGCPLIAIHKARYYRSSNGLAMGPGGFVTALEYAADCESEVLGKPSRSFFQMALERMGCTPERAFMIGDDVRDDIAGAQALGIRGILVKTGKYRLGDESTTSPPPFAVCDDFSSAVDCVMRTVNATL